MKKRPLRLSVLFTSAFILLMLGAIGLCWILNRQFLGTYYRYRQEKELIRMFGTLQESAQQGSLYSEEMRARLRQAVSTDSISIALMDTDSGSVETYSTDRETTIRRLWDTVMDATPTLEDQEDGETDTRSVPESAPPQDHCIVGKTQERDGYVLRTVRNIRTETDFLELSGKLSDGSYVLLRSALERIAKSSEAANRFLGYTGLLTILLGAAVSVLLSSRLTEPMRELTRISQRMKELDFSAKYRGGSSTREMQELGENMNELSGTLERTLSDLKTANNELQQDLARREQIEEMRREFLTNVTHELKTPLSLISGYAEGLQEGITEDPESRDFYCSVIVDEAGRMNRLVQSLMTLNQLEFGRMTAEMQRFDIVELAGGHLETVRLLAQRSGMQVRMEQTEPIDVWADPFLTEEVFSNYVSNALHYAEGEKIIDIRFERRRDKVRVIVFNTGKPIPEDILPHIWEKFYKVDKARTRSYGGSGVGLSIVKAAMELMHQAYGADRYDNGMAFWFELDTNAQEERQE